MAESRLVWIDLEMTGLYPDENTIIEIATIVTETDLSIVAEGPSFAIDVGKEELAKMDDWNVKHHTENGLLARICLLYTSPSPRDPKTSRMPSSA